MWNGKNVPPQTATPEIVRIGNEVMIKCKTAGASIGYKLIAEDKTEEAWRVYDDKKIAVPKGSTLIVRAHRIGYAPSETSSKF